MTPRVVFDTNTVVSALLFEKGRLAWLRHTWMQHRCVPVISEYSIKELLRVIAYPKFQLSKQDQLALLGDFLPYAETIALDLTEEAALPQCRDPHDQPFLQLAHVARVDFLVTGDADLLVLNGQCVFSIISPAEFRACIAVD